MTMDFIFAVLSLIFALVALVWVLVTRDVVARHTAWSNETHSFYTDSLRRIRLLEARLDRVEYKLTNREIL
jgi:hypothetical protein